MDKRSRHEMKVESTKRAEKNLETVGDIVGWY